MSLRCGPSGACAWVNWAALRSTLPPFASIKPRPFGDTYRLAAVAGMQGHHTVAVAALNELLRQALP